MKYIFRTMIFIICLIGMMSIVVSAAIEEEWPFGVRNPLPDDPTYVRFDFEKNSTYFGSYQGIVNFVDLNENKWASIPIGARGYHIYPMDFFYKYVNGTRMQVDYIYVVNGKVGAQPVFWRCTNVKCDWWPGNEARIEFPSGASDVSFLSSNGANLVMRAYDKTGKYIGSSDIAYSNTDRIPPNPSNFTRVSITTKTSSIYAVEIIAGINNFWLIDDIVVGGLTFPDEPINYNYAAERMKELIGVKFLEQGTGYDYFTEKYYTSQEIIDGDILYWNKYTKEVKIGNGIYDEDAILWAFNTNDDHINWKNIDKMASNDFKIEVKYGEQQPGDVFFLDYDGNGHYNEVGIFIEPMVDDTGDMVDIIRIIPDAGVHYSTAKFIHALYGTDDDIDSSSSMNCKRLPDNPKGGHSPYPKIPTKFTI